MKRTWIALLAILCTATSVLGLEKRRYMIREDYSMQMMSECNLQYYYYVPCPTYSWFWAYYGWDAGDVIGQVFNTADSPTGGYAACDSIYCYELTGLRILDFAGYGTLYPGLFTVEFDVYCADENGCALGPSLWNSGSFETVQDKKWNDVLIDPPLDVSGCFANPSPASSARFLITATHTGIDCTYPEWGFDNVSTVITDGCDQHVYGCLPMLYPRPYSSHYSSMHSAYYGNGSPGCPLQLFPDGLDTTFDGSVYGFVELAWRVHLECRQNAAEGTTWGSVKAMYR